MLPPLREHMEDLYEICIFLMAMLDSSRTFDKELLEEMHKYLWRGNLINLYAFICRLSEQDNLSTACIRKLLYECNTTVSNECDPNILDTAIYNNSLTIDRIQRVLDKHRGNKTLAAEELGISRTTLWKRLKEH